MQKQYKSETKEMKTASCSAVCGSASGGKNSTFYILPSAFLHAFTLLEVMIAAALFGLVVAGTVSVYIMCNKIWHSTSISMQTARESSLALSRLVYGLEADSGLRSASAITNINFPDGSWRMTVSNSFSGVKYIDYNHQEKILSNANSIICKDVSSATVTNNASGTIGIQLTVEKRDGMFIASNTVSTLVNMRNKP